MKKTSGQYDVIILGAGGTGLMCAAIAGQRGKSVLLIDHADKPGKKILISGGGRCNFTNLDIQPNRFLSQNPHFAKSALSQFTQHDFISMVDRHAITWHEKTLGQLFCDGSASQIVDMLLEECRTGNVTVKLGEEISTVTRSNDHFSIKTNQSTYIAEKLVLATGGPSIPKMGATGFAYDLARQFKLKIVEPRPALVPFTLSNDEALFSELSGIATDTIASNDKASFKEASLFTHKGLSGPAILQISSYWRHGEAVSINFLPEHKDDWLINLKQEIPRSTVTKAIATALPERLAETLAGKLDNTSRNLADFKDVELKHIMQKLQNWQFFPNGTEGFAKAEVTIGGISTNELSSKTMEAQKVPGLYAIGECVDVTGWLGGYNFQWAWSSGWVAGNAI